MGSYPTCYDKSMSRSVTSRYALGVANTFGAFGYISCLIQWMLVFVVLVLPLLANDTFRNFFLPTHSSPSAPAAQLNLPPFLQSVLLVGAIVFSLGIIVYAIVSIPRTVGRTGRKVTHIAADIAVTRVIQPHAPMDKKQQKTLIERITWSIKLIMLALPLLLLLIPTTPRYGVTYEHLLLLGVYCASMTLIWFTLQYIVVHAVKLKPHDVW